MGEIDDAHDDIEFHDLSDRELLILTATRVNGLHRLVSVMNVRINAIEINCIKCPPLELLSARVGTLEKWGYILTGIWMVVSVGLTMGVVAAWELAKKKWGTP